MAERTGFRRGSGDGLTERSYAQASESALSTLREFFRIFLHGKPIEGNFGRPGVGRDACA
jgi:hypothetical protein